MTKLGLWWYRLEPVSWGGTSMYRDCWEGFHCFIDKILWECRYLSGGSVNFALLHDSQLPDSIYSIPALQFVIHSQEHITTKSSYELQYSTPQANLIVIWLNTHYSALEFHLHSKPWPKTLGLRFLMLVKMYSRDQYLTMHFLQWEWLFLLAALMHMTSHRSICVTVNGLRLC